VGENRRYLKRPNDAALGNLRWLFLCYVEPIELDMPRSRLQKFRQQIKTGRFASPVGTN
jgi:hypothetical protein